MKAMNLRTLLGELKKRAGSSYSGMEKDLTLLVGAATALAGGTAPGALGALLALYKEKEKVISLGASALDLVAKAAPEDYTGCVEKMRDAYCLLFVTAYFDTLDRTLPDDTRAALALNPGERKSLGRNSEAGDLPFPDPVFGIGRVEEALPPLYRGMTENLKGFVTGLAFYAEGQDERAIRGLDQTLEKLPGEAVKQFWDKLHSQRGKREDFDRYVLDNRAREHEKWEGDALRELSALVLDSPRREKEARVREITEALVTRYRGELEKPLWHDAQELEELRFPSQDTAFIPQRFRLLAYNKQPLESAETWKEPPIRGDMASFWRDYMADYGSTERLLLILGEPGAGKSLLTRMLCARLIGPDQVLLRIPLREHDVEADPETLICRQLEDDGEARGEIPSFSWFAKAFPDQPITLLFDGYDEVMQATGATYRSLLGRMERFQRECAERRRPVRIVVTSRETLIDKADIPRGTLVMRLEEFDSEQQARWIQIWNNENHTALQAAGLEDFTLPEKDEDVARLASQPLLLLMLALYDADLEKGENALRRSSGLNRTQLYDRLLRRFIRRELQKGTRPGEATYETYENLSPAQRQEREDQELRLLGVAALGMFARGRLHLLSPELNADLKGMELAARRYDDTAAGRLSSAEALFGSFFFVYHAKAKGEQDETLSAYEFMHKTFYEFLLADLMLTILLDAADDLLSLRSARRGEGHYIQALESPGQLPAPYYAALSSALLTGEPAVVRMLGEWREEKLDRYSRGDAETKKALLEAAEALFNRHAALVLDGTFAFPAGAELLPEAHSFPQRCAAYLMNLLTLNIRLRDFFTVKPEDWRRLSRYFWLNATQRSSEKAAEDPAEENILDFMALFRVKHEDELTLFLSQNSGYRRESFSPVEERTALFVFLQDDTTRRLYRLYDPNITETRKQGYREILIERGIDMSVDRCVSGLSIALGDGDIRGVLNMMEGAFALLDTKDWRYYDRISAEKLLIAMINALNHLPDQEVELFVQQLRDRFSNTLLIWRRLNIRRRETIRLFSQLAVELGYGANYVNKAWHLTPLPRWPDNAPTSIKKL